MYTFPELVDRADAREISAISQYHYAIDAMIAANKRARSDSPMHPSETIRQWARQRATVRVDIGRRSGKTLYIKAHAKAGDLVLVPDELAVREHRDAAYTVAMPVHVERQSRGKVYRNIFIYEPAMIFRKMPVWEVYSHLAVNPEQTFILLGE